MKKGWIVAEVILAALAVALFMTKLKYGEKAIFCGGIAAIQCPAGYACRLEGSYPDAGGNCVRNK